MVERGELVHRLNEIRQAVGYLRKMTAAFLDEKEKFLLGRYYLQIALEAMSAVANQIIANERWRKPRTYREALEILAEEKVLSPKLAERLKPQVDLRNRLVHTYWKISKEELLTIRRESVDALEQFLRVMLRYLK
jgi:uncharacterized protein YutE (UPF0331/DUF86 family)